MTQLDPWPLRHLVISTPRLELRPDDDAGLLELVEVARRGVHRPEEMPFSFAWTDLPPDELGVEMLHHRWRTRAAVTPQDWKIDFLVRHEGAVIGAQGISGRQFSITREINSGSWVGLEHQGQSFGTEMRQAMLLFAFDHLGAEQARSAAFEDNRASLRVSQRCGYRADGTERHARRGEPANTIRLLLTGAQFAEHRPNWDIEVRGLTDCRSVFGVN